uniref:Ras modification protein ERF4 n=1 Tax=Saccoglossus kowalevskii TaxID=10224 RepID=A0ABM0LXJ1_SACKO|nr:PREDICTED: golgin subfamily A member 7-like [Saccoglossus kowalevskii]
MASSHHPQNQVLDNIPRQVTSKVFIQRDYSEGSGVKFITKFPTDLEGKIEHSTFQDTIEKLNSMFAEAEEVGSRSHCEGCLACLTGYTIFLCLPTHYQKCLKRIARFVQEQNDTIYVPRGLMITDPMERGLRVIEINILRQDT